MLTEQLINCFLSVVQNGSFTKAAEELFLTQQAVSKHVKKLEQELGTELLVRTTRMVHPTEQGEKYYQMFLKWKTELANLKEETAFADGGKKTLRIGVLQYMINGKVPEIVQRIKKDHPDYQISIIHESGIDLYRRLMDNDIDLAITYDAFLQDDREFKKDLFGVTGLNLMIARSHPLATDELKYSDLEHESFLVAINKGESKNHAMKESLKERMDFGMGNGPVHLFHTMEEVNLQTELGEGFTFCSDTSLFARNPMMRYYPLPKNTAIVGAWKKNNKNPVLKAFFEKADEVAESNSQIINLNEDTRSFDMEV